MCGVVAAVVAAAAVVVLVSVLALTECAAAALVTPKSVLARGWSKQNKHRKQTPKFKNEDYKNNTTSALKHETHTGRDKRRV